MKQIAKKFNNLKEAEKYLNTLYNKFDIVRLVSFPMFSEDGTYIFEVK